MSTISSISTGEQSVTSTGAITGSLNTASLTGDYTVKLRVRGLTLATQNVMVALEDTANASAFSDALQCWVASVAGATPTEGVTLSVRSYQLPAARFGATNTKLRFNCLAINGSPTALIEGWLEQ
jgi:hypothetical protein